MALMKQNGGGIRLKLGAVLESQLSAEGSQSLPAVGRLKAHVLATTIAAHTIKVLLEGEMLDPGMASEQLRVYGDALETGANAGQCILRFLFPDEGRLAMVVRWLNSQVNLHVWEIAQRLPPPELFYKAHPKILEACKLCGAVVLEASTLSTMTTGSINPLTGDHLARWIQAELSHESGETRPRFFFHVVIPPRLWPGILRSHFRYDDGV